MTTTAAAIAVRPDARTGRVRPFMPADLPAVARLHALAFPNRRMGAVEVEQYLAELFYGHPWQDDTLPSLVYESRPEICRDFDNTTCEVNDPEGGLAIETPEAFVEYLRARRPRLLKKIEERYLPPSLRTEPERALRRG